MNLKSELKKIDGFGFDMETTLTLNPDLTDLSPVYVMAYNKLSAWRLKGMTLYEEKESIEKDFCLVHQDSNIFYTTRGEKKNFR